MLANYVVTAAWGGSWLPRLAEGTRRLAARIGHRFTVPGTGHGEVAERRARFGDEARAAARAWLMV
jgi:hypothetical protein